MNVSSDALTDSSMLVGYNTSPSASNGAVHKRSVSTIWDYIASKIRSTFGFDSSNVLTVAKGGTGVTTEDAVSQLVFSHAPEASPTQAGVVKTLSDQDFCEYMGIDYNPDDWS